MASSDSPARRRRGAPLGPVAAAFVPPLLVMGLVALAHGHTGDFTQDPVALAHLPAANGIVSDLGVLLWGAAATAGLLALAAGRRAARSSRRDRAGTAALVAVSALYAADDLLLLHERVLPDHAGIPKGVTLAVLGILLLGAVVLGRDLLLDDWPLLTITLGFFAMWAGLRVVPYFGGRDYAVAAVKLAGASGWCMLVCRAALASLLGRVRAVPDPARA